MTGPAAYLAGRTALAIAADISSRGGYQAMVTISSSTTALMLPGYDL